MRCQVNINEFAKVQLTGYGVSLLKAEHEILNREVVSRGGTPLESFKLNLDEEGYATFEIWKLMATFGPCMYSGGKLPFDSEIIIITREDD